GLLGLAHALDDQAERVKLRPQQSDDKVVVVLVQAVAGEANVVTIARFAEGPADAAVLHQDGALLLRRKLLEAAGAPQRVPDRPGQGGVEHALAGAVDQRTLQVLLVADGVGAPQHRVFRLRRQAGKWLLVEKVAHRPEEIVWLFAQGKQADATRVVDVFV